MSTENKFTPGPWSANVLKKPNGGLIIEIVADQITARGTVNEGKTVVTWQGFDGCFFNVKAKANAQLISAAPDMYEALKEAADIVAAWEDGNLRGQSSQAGRKIRAALHKAEGGAND